MQMNMSQGMRMAQQMKLAPRMIQSMEILQLSAMALEAKLRQAGEENPTMELGPSALDTSETDLEPEPETYRDSVEAEYAAVEQYIEEASENFIPNHSPSRAGLSELADRKHDAMQNMVDRPVSMQDHLLEQLHFSEEPAEVLEFAHFIIANLDYRGFLPGSLESLRLDYSKPISSEAAEKALLIVQDLEPTGVGARSLQECLMLQLEHPDPEWRYVDELKEIVAHHFEDLEHNRLPVIEKRTGYSLETIHAAIDQLRHLELNPGAGFTTVNTQYIVADVVVERGHDGEWEVRVNDDHIPQVKISRHYRQMLENGRGDPQVLEYVKRKINAAQWLLESIEQRRNTLRKVTKAIIDHQTAFLEDGPEYIQPLKMQQIADKVGVHVTTISRAVGDKYVQTPRGTFALKSFFGGGTKTASGEDVAYDTIKQKLQEVIDTEDKSAPLSDEDLVNRIREMGYPLSRRTVTKYREQMGIPSSRQRKQHLVSR